MGFSGGSEAFDPVATLVLDSQAGEEEKLQILYTLACSIYDWDTMDESIETFRGKPVAVLALRMAQGDIDLYRSDGACATLGYDRGADQWVLSPSDAAPMRLLGNRHSFNGLLLGWAQGSGREEDLRDIEKMLID